jgi:hypothetical protein
MTDTRRKIYIAGPMSGYPEFNFPKFFAAEEILKTEFIVFNPANKEQEKELDAVAFETGDAKRVIEKGFDFRECYLWDVSRVIESDAIYMLPGWQYSPGACGEHAVAVAMKRHYPKFEIIYAE